MVSLMNTRFLAIVMLSLVIGAGLGYSISLPQTMTLISDYQHLNNSYVQLLQEHVELASEFSTLTADYSYLNESYVKLLQQYEDLLFHYNLINGSASNFTTVQDLQITLSMQRTTYYYKDPVSGNVTIMYLNGNAFEGSFTIAVEPDSGAGVGKGSSHTITSGFAEFYISPPVFLYGPGKYTIYVMSVTTTDGYIVGSNLWNPSIQVEAK